jgi:hypothetical protein
VTIFSLIRAEGLNVHPRSSIFTGCSFAGINGLGDVGHVYPFSVIVKDIEMDSRCQRVSQCVLL